MAIAESLEMSREKSECFYICKTMVHTSSLTGEILLATYIGARLIALNQIIPPSVSLKRIERFKPTFICANPSIIGLWLKAASKKQYDLSSVQVLYSCGAPASEQLLKEAEKYFCNADVLNVYGLTEAGPRVSAQRKSDENRIVGGAGRAVRDVKIEIRNEHGGRCQSQEKGRIFVSTPSLLDKYWNNEAATKEKIRDGWLDTGDCGYFLENGELFVVGRADDMIIKGGHNVDPNRIENVINKLAFIRECVVFGVPDKINGKKIICSYVREKDAVGDESDILVSCKRALAVYEYPQEIYEWNELPKTNSQKISRKNAVNWYFAKRGIKKKEE